MREKHTDKEKKLAKDIYLDSNVEDQAAFRRNRDLEPPQHAVHKSMQSQKYVNDSPLEMVHYQLGSIPLQMPKPFSVVPPRPVKKEELVDLMLTVQGRVEKLEEKQSHLETQLDTKWNDAMELIGKIIEKQGEEGLNESIVNSLHEKIYL